MRPPLGAEQPRLRSQFGVRRSSSSLSVQVISVQGGTVVSGSGVPIHTSRAFRGEPVDTLLVVGGPPESAIDADADTVALIRKMAPRVRRVASVCTGAFLLAAATIDDSGIAPDEAPWIPSRTSALLASVELGRHTMALLAAEACQLVPRKSKSAIVHIDTDLFLYRY
jgi:putative intracellular protease/amidase